MARGFYTVNEGGQAVTTAITILEVTAPSTAILRLMRAWAQQRGTTTDVLDRIRLLRKTATITGAASPPSAVALGAEAASGVTVKHLATAEGTDGNVLDEQVFHIKNGYLWVPTDKDEKVLIPPSGIIALKFPVAPNGTTWSFGIDYEEMG